MVGVGSMFEKGQHDVSMVLGGGDGEGCFSFEVGKVGCCPVLEKDLSGFHMAIGSAPHERRPRRRVDEVRVGATSEEKRADGVMAGGGSEGKSCDVVVVGLVDLTRLLFQDHLHCFLVALGDSVHEGGPSVAVGKGERSTTVEEDSHHFQRVVSGSEQESCFSLFVGLVDRHFLIVDQLSGDHRIAFNGDVHEPRPALEELDVGISSL